MEKYSSQHKTIEVVRKSQMKTPSTQAIEIAAKIMAKRAKRELEVSRLAMQQSKK